MFSECSKCTKCGQLILRKIINIAATRRHILRLKCAKIEFSWGSAPDPSQRSPDPLAGGKGEGRGRVLAPQMLKLRTAYMTDGLHGNCAVNADVYASPSYVERLHNQCS